MKTQRFAALAFLAGCTAWVAPALYAQTKLVDVDAAVGRDMALLACTGCHVVAPNQPFKPINTGPPRPPDFKEIANRPNVTTATLQRHLARHSPGEFAHAEPDVDEELRDVVAFIVSLRDK